MAFNRVPTAKYPCLSRTKLKRPRAQRREPTSSHAADRRPFGVPRSTVYGHLDKTKTVASPAVRASITRWATGPGAALFSERPPRAGDGSCLPDRSPQTVKPLLWQVADADITVHRNRRPATYRSPDPSGARDCRIRDSGVPVSPAFSTAENSSLLKAKRTSSDSRWPGLHAARALWARIPGWPPSVRSARPQPGTVSLTV